MYYNQQIGNKAHLYCRKVEDDLYLAIFLPNTLRILQDICCLWTMNIPCCIVLNSNFACTVHVSLKSVCIFSDSQDFDLIVIGGGSGGLACSKEGEKEISND